MATSQGTVTYRDVPGFPGYRVGDDGSVWSRLNGRWGYRDEWRRLKPGPDSFGYLTVALRDRTKNRSVTCRVNVLVLLAFVGPRPNGADACHYPDRDPSNNALSNLRWGTRAENVEDARKHGTLMVGESNASHKYNAEFVRRVREAYKPGVFGYKRVSAQFGIPFSTAVAMISRRTWKCLD